MLICTSRHETNQGQQEDEDWHSHHSRSSGKNAVAQIKNPKKCVIQQALVTKFCCLWRESGGNLCWDCKVKEGTHLSSAVVGVVMGEILQNYK